MSGDGYYEDFFEDFNDTSGAEEGSRSSETRETDGLGEGEVR